MDDDREERERRARELREAADRLTRGRREGPDAPRPKSVHEFVERELLDESREDEPPR
jgi:hypothetical protein